VALTFQAGNHSSDTEEEEEEEEKEEKEEDEEEEEEDVKTTPAEIDARDGCAVSKSVTIQEPEYEEEEEEQVARSPERSPSPPPVHEEAEEEEPEDRWRSSSPERKHSNGSDSYEEEQRASSMSPEPPRAIVKPANSAPAPASPPAISHSNSNRVKPSTPVLSPSSQDRDITKIYTGALGSAAAPAKDFSAEKVIRNKPASDITQIYTQVFCSYNILLCLVRISLVNKLDLVLNSRPIIRIFRRTFGHAYFDQTCQIF